MKKITFILAALVAGASLSAQAPAAANTSRVKIYGWIEPGVTLNSKSPDDHQNFGRLFEDRANEPLLNEAVLTIEQTLDPKPGQFDWGFKLQGMYGSNARFIHSLGLLDNTSNALHQPDIVEAYLNLHFAVDATAGGVDVKVGKFVTMEGVETIDPRTNVFYSHTYIFNFGIPFNHSGVLAVVHVTKEFDLYAGITRGVNTTFDDNNGKAAFHGAVGFNGLSDGKLTGLLSTHIGPETPGNNKDYRYLTDLAFTYALSDKQNLITDLNYIKDDAAKAKGYGIAEYYTHKVSDSVTIAVRGEVWHDVQGFYVAQFGNSDDVMNGLRGVPINDPRTVGGGATNYKAITVGAQISVPVAKPFAGLVVRPEIRYDWANTNAFVDSTRKSQFTVSVDAILTF